MLWKIFPNTLGIKYQELWLNYLKVRFNLQRVSLLHPLFDIVYILCKKIVLSF